jgi:hypothetical protein
MCQQSDPDCGCPVHRACACMNVHLCTTTHKHPQAPSGQCMLTRHTTQKHKAQHSTAQPKSRAHSSPPLMSTYSTSSALPMQERKQQSTVGREKRIYSQDRHRHRSTAGRQEQIQSRRTAADQQPSRCNRSTGSRQESIHSPCEQQQITAAGHQGKEEHTKRPQKATDQQPTQSSRSTAGRQQ